MDQNMSDLAKITLAAKSFAKERNWQQFHSPKNLSMALNVESSELLEIFQWLTGEESTALNPSQLECAAHELADIQLYLCLLADRLNIDLLTAVEKKMQINASRYPKEKAYGNAKKYTELFKR